MRLLEIILGMLLLLLLLGMDAAAINSPSLARWNKRFHWSFLMLTLCCVGVFAAHDQGVLVVYT